MSNESEMPPLCGAGSEKRTDAEDPDLAESLPTLGRAGPYLEDAHPHPGDDRPDFGEDRSHPDAGRSAPGGTVLTAMPAFRTPLPIVL
ncbi:MAG TPA: hypothetical protein VF414_09940, partial [Thermoanaerobaculia bacterium]